MSCLKPPAGETITDRGMIEEVHGNFGMDEKEVDIKCRVMEWTKRNMPR